MNVLEFFELESEPFANSPDGRFFFESAHHAEVMARLRHVTGGMRGLAIVVGDIGAGKTTLARRFMETLEDDDYEAALLVVVHTSITSDWLLTKIAMQLGVEEPSAEKVTLLGQLYVRLRELNEAGKRAVVLVDEAQMLQSKEIMQELRGLLNLELPGRKLLSLVFFGLPEIEHTIALDPPLAQRVALKVRLQALPHSSTEEYIKHRLKVAGARQIPFTREAVAAVHRYSRGTPRLINTLCDNAMLEAFLLRRRTIGESLITGAARDLGLVEAPPEVKAAAAAATGVRAALDPLDPRLGAAARPAPALPRPTLGIAARPPAARPGAPVAPRPGTAAAPRAPAAPRPLAPAGVLRPQGAQPSAPVRPGPGQPGRPAPAAPLRPGRAPAAPQPARPAPAAKDDGFENFDDLLAEIEKS